MEEDSKEKIEWDLEELKRAYLRNAEEYDKLMKKEEEEDKWGLILLTKIDMNFVLVQG